MQQIQVISIRNQRKTSAGSYQLMSHKPLTITAMAKDKTLYTCNDCGATTPRWLGKCPSCGAWNSLVETVAETPASGKNRMGAAFAALGPARPPARVSWTACWAAASSRAAWC